MSRTDIHITIREDWLKSGEEAVLEENLPIIDPHHHLWDRPEGTYFFSELRTDTGDGHRIIGTVFVQCRSMYRKNGPELLRPLGEIEFANGIAAQAASGLYGDCQACAGIVGMIDLTRGDAVVPALEAAISVTGGRLKGLRIPVAWHPDPEVVSSPARPPEGLMASDTFRAGVRRLGAYDLSLDIWAYHTQHHEIIALAKAVPEVTFVVDHCGGPIGIGPYADQRGAVFQVWLRSIQQMAQLPNIVIKIGGLGMRVAGFAFHEGGMPPSSLELAEAWKPYFETLIEAFSPDRCMFESNSPVDKGMFSYRAFWNACKRLSGGMSASERTALFSGTALRTYRLNAAELIR